MTAPASPPHAAPPTPPSQLYVGYRPLSAKQKHTLALLIPALLVLLAFIAFVLAASQLPAGKGSWDARITERVGTLTHAPVPILWVRDSSGTATPILLVEEGKHGAQARCEPLANTHVTIRGTTLARESLLIAELAASDAGLRPTNESPLAPPTLMMGPRVTLRGEIVDAKCYAGAMKPGDRKAHKACATLCIANGIPAVLVVPSPAAPDSPAANATNEPTIYLCIPPTAGTLDADTLSKIGEPIEVTGTLGSLGPLRTITIEPGSVTRR